MKCAVCLAVMLASVDGCERGSEEGEARSGRKEVKPLEVPHPAPRPVKAHVRGPITVQPITTPVREQMAGSNHSIILPPHRRNPPTEQPVSPITP